MLAVLGGYLLAYRCLPRTVPGMLLGFAVVLFGFDLFNKQSFENQWWFVCELLVCGLALATAADRSVAPDDRPAVPATAGSAPPGAARPARRCPGSAPAGGTA